MRKNPLGEYRRIWPFEPSGTLSFMGHEEVKDMGEYTRAQEIYEDLFTKFHKDYFLPSDLNGESKTECDGLQRVVYRIVTSNASDIQIEFLRYEDSQTGDGELLVQDRLEGKVRNQYAYFNHKGEGILRVCDGDRAAQVFDVYIHNDKKYDAIEDFGVYVSSRELAILGNLISNRGERIMGDDPGPVSLLDLLYFEDKFILPDE